MFLGELRLVEVCAFERDSKNLFASLGCTRDKKDMSYKNPKAPASTILG
jgi:hypothetical protein